MARRFSETGRLERCGNIGDLRALARRRVPGMVFDYVGKAGKPVLVTDRFCPACGKSLA